MNTLNQILQEKFPHLEVSVLKLSEVKRDNETKRMDSEFFKKEYLENEKIILKHEWDYLGNLAKSIINFGAYSLCNYIEYVDKDDGVPFLNVGDIRENSINYENAKYIPLNTSKNILHKSLAKENQVLLTIAGSIGFAAVSYRLPPFTNSNQAIANIEILTINPFYLSTYLNCRFGKSQMNKLTMSSVQPNLLLTQVKQIKIPLLPMPFQLEIEKLVKDSHLALEQSKALYKEAETLLYVELGLDPANPMQSILSHSCHSEPALAGEESIWDSSGDVSALPQHDKLTNFATKTLKETFLKTGRLDSEYYQSKYDKIETFIKSYKRGFSKLEITEIKDSNFIPKSKENYRYIELANIGANGNISSPLEELGEYLPTRARRLVKEGDLIISSVEGSLGSCALITKEFHHCIVSTGFYVLKSQSINSETLLVLFKSSFFQHYLKKFPSGTILSAISKEELQNILIPKIDFNIQKSIAQHIQTSFTLRTEAKNLLNAAKQKVEYAIKNGGGGANHVLFVSLKREIFRIYYPQIKAKLKESKVHYRLSEWLLYGEVLFGTQSILDSNYHSGTLASESNSAAKVAPPEWSDTQNNRARINYTIHTLKQSLGTSGRLDSEYYQAKYKKNENLIQSKPHAKLGDIVIIKKSIEPGSEAYTESGIPFIRVSNLNPFGISPSEIYLDSKDFHGSKPESLYPKKDTILLSKDGSIGIAYCVEKDMECVTSGAILHLQVKDKSIVLPQYLALILNSCTTQLQAQRDSGGSIIAHWKIEEIKNVLIPLLDIHIQKEIESKIAQSFALRAKSKNLLENAKSKLENTIHETSSIDNPT